MLLIDGRLYENADSQWAIDTVSERIIETLTGEPLDIHRVLSASGRLAGDILSGGLNGVLEGFLDDDIMSSYDLVSIASSFKTQELQKRLHLELGHLRKRISKDHNLDIAPLGTLLHIAAGNMDILPAFSVLEGLLSGNINILKLPSMDRGLSIYLLKKMIEYEPCLRNYIYVFDTPSQDFATIQSLMDLVNAIVTWGNDDTIKAIRVSAPINTKIIEFGHKLSFVYLAQSEVPNDRLTALARHIFATKQLLCSSCQVIFLNTHDFEDVKRFGRHFSRIMKEVEHDYSSPMPVQGKVSIELLTRTYERIHSDDVIFRNDKSSVICVNNHELEGSPQLGNVFIKPLPIEKVTKALYKHRSHLQTVGVYPRQRDIENIFIRAGLTNIRDIDDMSSFKLLGSHDGKFPLLEYSRIVEF
ncbi:MAG TPA: acyl-CoA reductase [Clostridia bacterium]|nr:acyl-CoA reductase [Clostridia bacterium]